MLIKKVFLFQSSHKVLSFVCLHVDTCIHENMETTEREKERNLYKTQFTFIKMNLFQLSFMNVSSVSILIESKLYRFCDRRSLISPVISCRKHRLKKIFR